MAKIGQVAPVVAVSMSVAEYEAYKAKKSAPVQKQVAAPKAEVLHPVVALLRDGGAMVHRTGKSGLTSSGRPRIWVDCSFSGCRFTGNVYQKS